MGDGAQEAISSQTCAQLQFGLRVAVFVTTAIAVSLDVNTILRFWEQYDSRPAQLCSFGALAGLLAIEATLVARRRAWASLRFPAVAVVVAASLVSYASRPDDAAAGSADWAFGAANWVGLVILLNGPLWTMVAFLSAHGTIALAGILAFSGADPDLLLRLTTASVSVIGYPMCFAVVSAVLRAIAARAATATREAERVRTTEAVAVEAHRRRTIQMADLNENVIPLLQGLASGRLDPEDRRVQRRCAVQAARLRRLFAEADDVSDRLAHELRHCADVADRKGVLVELDVRGRWRDPPPAVRRDLTEAPLTVLATAVSWARVTVVGNAELVSVSVVADSGDVTLPRPAHPAVRLEEVREDSTLWVEARWQTT